MKFVLTIESNDLEDLTWIASRLRMGGTATAVVGPDPTVNFPDEPEGAPLKTAPEPDAPKKRIGRPPKAAASAAVSEAAEPAKAAAPAPKATGNGSAPEGLTPLPSLDALKGAVTTAVRKAQKGEGSTAILDLLGGFKDATGLDYVMNAKEEHKPALVGLLTQAGIQIPV